MKSIARGMFNSRHRKYPVSYSGNMAGLCSAPESKKLLFPPRGFNTPFPTRIMLIPQKRNRSKRLVVGVKRGTSPFLGPRSQEIF